VLRLDDDYSQVRVAPKQFTRGPESGVARTHDNDIGVETSA
jgi:hypothetical protein